MEVTLTVLRGPQSSFSWKFTEHVLLAGVRDEHGTIWLKRATEAKGAEFQFVIEIIPPQALLVNMGYQDPIRVNGSEVAAPLIHLAHEDRLSFCDSELLIEMTGTPNERRRHVQCERCGIGHAGGKSPWYEGRVWYCIECRHKIIHQPWLLRPVLPDYSIDGPPLGQGSMGAVYRAWHHPAAAPAKGCALKILLPRACLTHSQQARFTRGASVQAGARHPHIIEVYEPVRQIAPGIWIMSMEFVDGLDAEQLREKHGGTISVGAAVRLIRQILDALTVLHGQGVVHRDIKPQNIIIDAAQLTAKLTDFGLAKYYREVGLTTTEAIGGTVRFMAPEQAVNLRDATPAADIYSAGATLYFLLCGAYPHDFVDGINELLVVRTRPPSDLALRNPVLPPALCAVIMRALHRDPQLRYPDAQAMREALQPFGCRSASVSCGPFDGG